MPIGHTDKVEIEGLDALTRGFKRVDKDLGKQLQHRLRTIGAAVALTAKAEAPHKTGALARSIRPTVRGGSVYVSAPVRRKSKGYPAGYRYANRIEFQDGGRDAFLRPAVEHDKTMILYEFERLLDWIADEWGRTGL